MDTTGLSDELKNCVQKIIGKYLHELVSSSQIDDLKSYLNDVRRSDTSIVSNKFNLSQLDELTVKMKSKKNNNCIIATHSIIKPIQFDEQQPQSSQFRSSTKPTKPIQVQQVQLKQNLTTNRSQQLTNSTNLSPQTPTTSSTLYTSNFDFQTASATLSPTNRLNKQNQTNQDSLDNSNRLVRSTTGSLSNISLSSNSSPASNSQFKNENSTDQNNCSQPQQTEHSIDMLNDCLSISEIFPSSSLIDNLNSVDATSPNIDFNLNEFSSNAQDDLQMGDPLDDSVQADKKLRNLLQPHDSLNQGELSFSKQMSSLTTGLSKMDANQPTTSSSSNDHLKDQSADKETFRNSAQQQSNQMLNEILNQEDDFRLSTSRPSSSLSNSNLNNNDLESLFEKCNTIKPSAQTTNRQQTKSPSTENTKVKANNMLRKLLNDDDSNSKASFNKGRKDVLIQQLLRENSQPGASSTVNTKLLSPIDQNSSNSATFGGSGDQQQQPTPANSKFGPLKRKSNEDHFSTMSGVSQTGAYLNSSNNSCFSNSQPGTPNQIDTMETTYPSAKRLSLSESLCSRPSSTPIPVTNAPNRNPNVQSQVRYSTSSTSIGMTNQSPIQMNQQANMSVNSPLNTMNTQQQQQMSFTVTQPPPATAYQAGVQQQQNLLILNSNNLKQTNPNQSPNVAINNSQPQQQQSQQLAGQNPMLALMLAQTPKTPPVSSISIPTSIVSQVPQERLPKNLEKKLIHTPTSVNPQYSNQLGQSQFDNEPLYQSSPMVASQLDPSSNPHTNKTLFTAGSQPQSQQFYLTSRTANLQQTQQMSKPVQIQLLSGQFIQSNDQQQTPLSTTHLLNSNSSSSTHQPASVQVSGNSSQYLVNNKVVAASTSGALNPNQNEAKTSSSSSINQSTNGSFVMNSNQMPSIMNVQARNQPQLSTSSCSFYSDRITSSTNLSGSTESSSVAISSSTNGNVFAFLAFFSFFFSFSFFFFVLFRLFFCPENSCLL